MTVSPSVLLSPQAIARCRSRLWLLYWVSTQIRRIPPLTRLDNAKSTSRYRPPNDLPCVFPAADELNLGRRSPAEADGGLLRRTRGWGSLERLTPWPGTP